MAVTSVDELFAARTGKLSRKYRTSYKREYRVLTDSASDDVNTILTTASLPNLYEVHPSDSAAYVVEIDAKPLGRNMKQWHVTVEYSNEVNPGDEDDSSPIDQANFITFSGVPFSKRVESDKDGNAVTNTLGAKFDPPPEIQAVRPLMSVRKNVLTFNADFYCWYGADPTINNALWTISDARQSYTFAPRTALFLSFTSTPMSRNGINYYELAFEFEIKTTEWNPLYHPNQGVEFLDDNNVEQVARDAQGTPTGEVFNLDADGKIVPEGGELVFVEINAYEELNFTSLGL